MNYFGSILTGGIFVILWLAYFIVLIYMTVLLVKILRRGIKALDLYLAKNEGRMTTVKMEAVDSDFDQNEIS